MRRSQKRNDSQVIGHFALLGYTCVKAARKHDDEIDFRLLFEVISGLTVFCYVM